jgi:Uma2 family endonuclease
VAAQIQERDIYLPRRRLWTVKEFDRAGRLGIFKPDERLELIEGEVIQKLAPQESPHATAIRAIEIALGRSFLSGYDVRCQLPLVFGTRNKPEPDIAVVLGSFRDYSLRHPSTAVLVVEVSDSTLRLDRSTKAAIYARASIAEYWIVNLKARVLEVRRNPEGDQYCDLAIYQESATISPLANSDAMILVSDLLP